MTDAMREFFGDFPNRPDHADFWKLSEIVLGMDAMMEHPDGFERAIKAVGDPRSVIYMAQQRALRLVTNPVILATATAMWLDGFIAGTRYREARP